MDDVKIIKLPIKRWPEYRSLRLDALKLEPHVYEKSLEEEKMFPDEHWIQRLKSANKEIQSWLFFAQKEKKLVGMTGGYIRQNQSNSVEIVGVFVSPKYRGNNIGAMLFKKTIAKILTRKDIHSIRVEVNINQSVAINLYKKFGFKEVERENLVLGDGKSHILVIMEKPC